MHGEIFINEREEWSERECARAAKRVATDGLGTKYPWPGYIGSHYGRVQYNGGCVRNGKWYQGEEFPTPKVAEGFEIIRVPTWGCRIVRVGK